MKKAIVATKVGMTQIFDENGVLTPVTVLQAGPLVVTLFIYFKEVFHSFCAIVLKYFR